MDSKEDQAAPIGQLEMKAAVQSDLITKSNIVNKILSSLNEKRDAYNGIITSIVYLIDSQDVQLTTALKEGLINSIVSRPMRFGGKIFLTKGVPRLVSERPIFIADLFEQVIESTLVWSQNFVDESEVLRIQIISLKAIKQSEQSKGGRATKINQSTIDIICSNAILLCDDSTKVDTLSIILESRSTTKPLEERDLDLFRVLFRDALNFQEPGLRQIFIALTNKLLKRLKASNAVVMRDVKRYSIEQRVIIKNRYMEFLKWLIEFCFDSIYSNAYFGSFILTISTLKLVIQHITFLDEHLGIETYFNSRRSYDSILSCLNDSFDENKMRALDLLLSLPYNEQFFGDLNLNRLDDIAYRLVASVNPAHSSICQYVFKLIIGMRLRLKGQPKSRNQLLLEHLDRLVDVVEAGIKETRENFVLALKNEPIYPKLSVIRSLLDEVDYEELDKNRDEWVKLSRRIVSSSIEACKSVSNIVCNLNPETIGHLPMDLKPVDVDTLSKTLKLSLDISTGNLNTITSQMLLICGWKTIKECSLSLGLMCVRFWWPKERIRAKEEKFPSLDSDPILNRDDIVKILEFFDHYLKNLRHRGAFEQAYNGFILVTRRVWHDEHLRNLLIGTLQGIMNDFKNGGLNDEKAECLKAYVTRRSAGLPFIVQAILNSEHKHDSKTLRWVLDSLFEVLESKNSELYQRIHCLNILRALIKEHFLGEKVLSYVGRTFAITMNSFRSDSFSIRNCANMLLKATVDRTFGVNRLRDDISRRNQLSFERFFTECPNLHSEMLRHLKDGLEDRRCLAAVHSVFIILFRLKPSLKPHRGYISDTIIEPFINPIAELAFKCPDYKIRELASRLTVRLESFCDPRTENINHYPNSSKQSCEHPSCSRDIKKQCDYILNRSPTTNDRNRLHGALLMVKSWIENDEINLNEDQNKQLLEVSQQIILDICLSSDRRDTNIVIKTVALDLAECCYLRSLELDNQESWLAPLYDVRCFTREDSQEPFFDNLVFKYVTVLLMTAFPIRRKPAEVAGQQSSPCLQQIVDIMMEIVIPRTNSRFGINLQASTLRFLRQLLNRSNESVEIIFEKLDIDSTAALMTPFDQLKVKPEYDSGREKLIKYCSQEDLRIYLEQSLPLKKIFNLTSYAEFRSLNEKTLKFSSRYSNTLRSIEFLALIYENWEKFDLEKNSTWLRENESSIDKLSFITDFIFNLPDCDVKCLAMLCAGKAMQTNIDGLLQSKDQGESDRIMTLERFCSVLNELADGHHSLTIRETCCEVLRQNVKGLFVDSCNLLKSCQISLLSALIKLSQDEEHEVRSLSHRAIFNLRQEADDSYLPAALIGSRLDYLIRLITSKLFHADNPQEISGCFDLMMRIIFNHSINYSSDTDGAKEKLFDKTKLNAFADHVATVQSCLEGLQAFFKGREELIELNALHLSDDILLEFKMIVELGEHDTGDYSWRFKKLADGSSQPLEQDIKPAKDNNQIVNEFLENVLRSLEYFSKGYHSMLIDTEYTHHELSLFKRIAFVKFVLNSTRHELERNLIDKIKVTLEKIVNDICSTTMLHKCLKLME